MRDWFLVLIPIGIALYVLVHPEQLKAVIYWLGLVVR
jgi:hypothetical protein